MQKHLKFVAKICSVSYRDVIYVIHNTGSNKVLYVGQTYSLVFARS
jgi:hypothetical protein